MKYYNGIKKSKNYFEGWFFKHSSKNLNIAFIPSISLVNKNEKKCYIQVICDSFSHTFEFPYADFSASKKTLFIKIGENEFSDNGIKVNLSDNKYQINANFTYESVLRVKKDIMGPFRFFPFMECKHGLYSMKHYVNGNISINNINYNFSSDYGYIEKDLGKSFPTKYVWLQSNNFKSPTSFFLSIATIPYLKFKFQGLISCLIIDEEEYRFSTYKRSKIITLNKDYIELKKGFYTLKIYICNSQTHTLKAPRNGLMNRKVNETLNGVILLELYKKDVLIFNDTGTNAGIEISN